MTESFGQALRAVRIQQGIDQLSLGIALGASDASYICRLERGVRTNPSFAFTRRLTRAFAELGCALSRPQVARLVAAAVREVADDERRCA